MDRVIAESQPVQTAAPIVLQNDISRVDQFPEDVPPCRGFQVELEAAFATVDVNIPDRVAGPGGVIDFNHVRPEFGQGPAAGWTGEDDAQIEHACASQGTQQRGTGGAGYGCRRGRPRCGAKRVQDTARMFA